jgi:NAD-dependent dihydropyrimidine dehydrogenase PreA subunit
MMYAYRNVRLCSKDCLCLYVCPTGAADTENSIIDAAKCTGCQACVNACPSGAISMIPDAYPPQQPKTEGTAAALGVLAASKMRQRQAAEAAAAASGSKITGQFAKAVARSNLLMAEDILREAGYMLPQSDEVRALLEAMLENAAPGFPAEAAELLLRKLSKADFSLHPHEG